MFRKLFTNKSLNSVCALFIVLMMASCTSTKELEYFQDLPNTTVTQLNPMPQENRVIEIGDDINIAFIAKDDAAAAFFNKAAVVSSSFNNNTNTYSTDGNIIPRGAANSMGSGLNYLVDPNGNIEFPQIGRVKVTGLTTLQLKETLTKMVADKLKEPIVEVRFNSMRISVIGDVRSPGTFMLPIQKPTLFQALAAAGDLSPTAKRYDVQIYRDYNGQRKITRLDLRSQAVLNNPDVFLMRHNDVIIVKPAINAIARENINRVTAITGLAIGLIGLALTLSNNN
jgi:polysaccharide export outer membrane protein